MNKATFEGDGQIHHSEGKDPQDACPACHPQLIKETGTSPPFLRSQFVSKSPPGTLPLHSVEEQGKVKKFRNRFWNFCKHREQVTNIQYFVEKLTLEVTDEFMNNKQMKDYMINNITALYCVVMNSEHNNESKEQSNEEANTEESDNADHSEVVEVQNFSQTRLIPYFSHREYAKEILEWLHNTTDGLKGPKRKLKPIRAAYEAGVFTQLITHEDYVCEFGPIARSRYNDWMGVDLRYKATEIDPLIEYIRRNLPPYPDK